MDDMDYMTYGDDAAEVGAMTINDYRDEFADDEWRERYGDDGYANDEANEDDEGPGFNLGEGNDFLDGEPEEMGGGEEGGQDDTVEIPFQERVDMTFGAEGGVYTEASEAADSLSAVASRKTLAKKKASFSRDTPLTATTSSAKAIFGKQKATEKFITGSQRKTRPYMTKFEYTAIIGERATAIEAGATDVDPRVIRRAKAEGVDNALDIAEMELEMTEVDFPMTIHRRIDPNVYEVWNVRELLLPSQLICTSYSPEATRLLLGDRGDHCPHDVSKALTTSYKRFVLVENTV